MCMCVPPVMQVSLKYPASSTSAGECPAGAARDEDGAHSCLQLTGDEI